MSATKNAHASAMSALGAAKGGRARAKRLSADKRAEIARQAAAARWAKSPLPKAVCGSPDRPLRIADIEIACYVLEDGRRVLSQRGLQTGIGMSTGGPKSGEHRIGGFVASLEAKGAPINELTARIREPILFVPPGGGLAHGYEATVLPDLCDAVLEARRLDLLQPQQRHIAFKCEILVRAFAKVGIIALVDEATGYQDLRARDALAKILEAFIAKDLQKWVRTFPPDFYKEMFRLRGIAYNGKLKAPRYIGHLTNDIIYARVAPSVLEALRQRNPVLESGRRANKHHQWLTPEAGHPKLLEHLAAVTTLMKVADSWDAFKSMLDRGLPKYSTLPLLRDVQE